MVGLTAKTLTAKTSTAKTSAAITLAAIASSIAIFAALAGAGPAKLSKSDQTLHALNRLSYGPRPGDVDAVEQLGLKKWIELQLHPERIAENPVLAEKLAPLESLRINQADAARNYPSPQMLRAIAAGREKMPEDPLTRASVQRLMQRFKTKKGAPEDEILDPAVPLETLLTPAQVQSLRTGSVEQKREVLSSVPENKWDELAIAMPAGLRFQVMAAASPELRRKLMLMNAPQQLIAFDLSEGKLYRAIYSNRQLQEQLVDFWFNHFNVFLDKGADRLMVPTYERETIRPFVLGKFRDLLEATAKSPAMLFYLDNWESVAPAAPRSNGKKQGTRGLNENYGRELLELHTLGVDGGYTQKDVTEVARCFTGWTIRQPREGGDFFFNERIHDKGEKTVLGVKIPAGGGKNDAEKVLDILAKHPSTAKFVSKKLAQRFVSDSPPQKLVDKMAKTFRNKHGDIAEVLKTMFNSDEFWAQDTYRAKLKTPLEMIVSAVRATGADVDFAFPLANQIAQLGQPLYRKLEPTGYSNTSSEWLNSAGLLARMNFGLSLAQNRVAGAKVDSAKLEGTPAEVGRRLLFIELTPETLEAIDQAVQKAAAPAPVTNTKTNMNTKKAAPKPQPPNVAGLVLGSPEFQRR